MKKHKVFWFYIFTFICTIIIGGLCSALVDPSDLIQNAISLAFMQMSPSLGLLLICVFSKDFEPFKELKFKFNVSRHFIWVFISIIIPVVIICGSAFILSVLGKPYISGGYNTIPLIIVIIASIIGCIGEEIGWRGFMLPSFHKKHSLLVSAIFTGLLWGAWHFGKIQMSGIIGYLLFIFMIMEFTILMSWLFYKTNKSLIPMILFHLGINICSIIMLNERESILFYIIGCIIGGILCFAFILVNKSKFLDKSSV